MPAGRDVRGLRAGVLRCHRGFLAIAAAWLERSKWRLRSCGTAFVSVVKAEASNISYRPQTRGILELEPSWRQRLQRDPFRYSVNAERRSFALLRPISDSSASDALRDTILAAYAEYEQAIAS